MNVCVQERGSDPDGCLLVAMPNKDERDAWLTRPLPWCLGPYSNSTATLMRNRFNEAGGSATTANGCANCVSARVPVDLRSAFQLLNRFPDAHAVGLAHDLMAGVEALELDPESSTTSAGEKGAVQNVKTLVGTLRTTLANAHLSIKRITKKHSFGTVLRRIATWITVSVVALLTAILAVESGEQSKALKIVLASVGAGASLLTALSEHLLTSPLGKSTTKQLEELATHYEEADRVARTLELWLTHATPRPPYPQLEVDRAKELIAVFLRLEVGS